MRIVFLTNIIVDEIEHRIVYKGNTFWITKKKNGDTNKEPNNFYSNDLKELLGAMSSNPCIQITMRGQDLKLLQSIIQGWIDTAFKKVNGKVNEHPKRQKTHDSSAAI